MIITQKEFLFIFSTFFARFGNPWQEIKSSQDQLFWTQFRASLANKLILENGSLDPDKIYKDIYSTFPLDGNCWCYLDKSSPEALKGPPQDPYDTVCRHYHKCIYCGECQDVQQKQILNQGIYEEFSINVTFVSSFQATYNIEYLNLFNYNLAATDIQQMYIYEWTCSKNNGIVAQSVCICFKAFEDEFIKIMTNDINNSKNPQLDIEFNYNPVCLRTEAPSESEIFDQYVGYGFRDLNSGISLLTTNFVETTTFGNFVNVGSNHGNPPPPSENGYGGLDMNIQ